MLDGMDPIINMLSDKDNNVICRKWKSSDGIDPDKLLLDNDIFTKFEHCPSFFEWGDFEDKSKKKPQLQSCIFKWALASIHM